MSLPALARPNQSLLDHLLGVGESASQQCPDLADWARLIGLLHDYGKYRPEWVLGINEIAQGRKSGKLPKHAAEGALYLLKLFSAPSQVKVRILALAIVAHHSGLPDSMVGIERLAGKDSTRPLPKMNDREWQIDAKYLDELKQAVTAVNYADLNAWMPLNDYRTAQRIRFLFGALVAADRQDAAMSDGWKPAQCATMQELADRLATWYQGKYGNPQKPLDRLRCDFYAECRVGSKLPAGWLSVRGSCGISKTWSVMQMALDHAAKWKKRKVIYCVPWTAILEQSYEQYRERLGEENVTGHWSTLLDPKTQDPEQLRNSRQWWDTPIVATTMVQLFDILLGSTARTAQRMPSLQDAVIVLDEVQGLPNELLTTCIKILDQLVQDFGATIILCTATMPDYTLLGINPVEALSQAGVDRYFAGTRRVDYQWRKQRLSWQDIANEIVQTPMPSTLIVANTVAGCDDAYQIISSLTGYKVYKYTASMSPAHRSAVLAEIKTAVELSKLEGGQRVIICATSAIETGIDLDCSRGYRELNGLESIAQFGGRINRNLEYEISLVIIFTTAQEYPQPPDSNKRASRTLEADCLTHL